MPAILHRVAVGMATYEKGYRLFHESEIDSCNETEERHYMIPMKALSLKNNACHDSEYNQRHNLLNHFKLYEREWTAIALKPDTVGWNHETILKKCYRPGHDNDGNQRPRGGDAHLLKT